MAIEARLDIKENAMQTAAINLLAIIAAIGLLNLWKRRPNNFPAWLWPQASAPTTILGRLGRVLHGVSYAFAIFMFLFTSIIGAHDYYGNFDAAQIPRAMLIGAVIALAIATAGRISRYILSGE